MRHSSKAFVKASSGAMFLWGGLLLGCGSEDLEPNQAPEILAQADTSIAVGDTLRLNAFATDVDDHDLSFRLAIHVKRRELTTRQRIDATLDPETGFFWFRPGGQDRPGRRFVFRVEDGHGGQDSTEFEVDVR